MFLKIGNWGGSAAVRLPKSAVTALGIEEGTEVEATLVEGALVIRPIVKRYTLEELVKEAKNTPSPAVVDDEPVGAEWPTH